ncbi:MAG TPA: FGGY family carbohydrate kinase [Candidatus Limnocylindrales bacterium]|nr:FGGY family carbohydrate kinase [Candidatus Limnocylindrales bacterium]
MRADLVLAIDEGTSSARAIVYDPTWQPIATASRRLRTDHPQAGWAEQDPDAIVSAVVEVVGEALDAVGGPERIAAAGLANQGETVVAWDRHSGAALAPAILWSCRRSQPIVERVATAGHGPRIRQLTGLPLDPYFSASKLRWLLETVPAVRRAATDGRLAFGTVDAWLTARLGAGADVAAGASPAAGAAAAARTDPSTASRTQLMGLASLAWDDELLGIWDLDRRTLPAIVPTVGDLGSLHHPSWGAALPLRAMVCDQQAALAGQAGQRPGAIKATFGTGVFVLANAGSSVPQPSDGILATVAWTDAAGRPTYALDGGVFSAGSLLDWLHADLGIVDPPNDLDRLAGEVPDSGGVRLLPALAGLGAPWWDPAARVTLTGLSAATRRSHLARAALDAIAQRTADIIDAMAPLAGTVRAIGAGGAGPLRVDGGLAASDRLVQRLADLINGRVEVAADGESTALGTAILAAIGAGRMDDQEAARIPGTRRTVEPALAEPERRAERDAWRDFVERAIALSHPAPGSTHD